MLTVLLFVLGCGVALTGVAGLRQRARTGGEKGRIVLGLACATAGIALWPSSDDFLSRKLQRGCLSASEIATRACGTHEAIPPQPSWCYPVNVTCAIAPPPPLASAAAGSALDASDGDSAPVPDGSATAARCQPGARRCAGVYAETCSAGGQWGSPENCSKSRPCRAGVCTLWTQRTPPAASY